MPEIDITDRAIRGIRLGTGTYLDKTMRGFMLVSNAASMSYVLQRKINGRSVRVTLGRVGEISADEARDAAMEAWLQIKKGVNLPCLHLKVEDQQPISRRDLKLALGFLADRTAVGHRVLVHCWAGVSRSPAIVAVFMAMTSGNCPPMTR